MADNGWRRRRGSSPAAPTGARQRPGLTPPPPPTHFHASERRFTHNSSGQSKKSIDSDHGIYRYSRPSIAGEAGSPRAPEESALQNFTEATRGGKCPALASVPQATIAMEGDVS